MTPEQEPLHRTRWSQGAAVARPWAQAVLQDLLENRADGEPAGVEHERTPAVTPPARQETVPSGARGGRHRTARPREVTRRAAPEDTFDAAAVTSRIRHGDSLHRRGLRWLHTLVNASHESIRLSGLTTALQRPVTTGRRIAVIGARGGVGKTTISLLVASVLAARRDDAVLAVDADPQFGSLLWRAGVRSSDSAPNLADQLLGGRVTDRQQLESLLPRTPAGLWVVGDSRLEADGPLATDSDTSVPLAVTRAVGRFFGVTVLDCGGGWGAPDVAVDIAHATVLVASATVDGVRAMHVALDDWAQRPDSPLPRSVVALVSRTSTREGVDLRAATNALSAHGPQVVHIPYDRHLAAGAPIDVRRIGEPTLVAAVELAGVALALAVGE